MASEMEEILGLGPIDPERRVPGTHVVDGRECRYVSRVEGQDLAEQFTQLVRKVDPPLAEHGGVVNEGCSITLPDGRRLFAVSYKGDIEGWRQQIEQGAVQLGLAVASVSSQSLVLLSSGEEVPLSECAVGFH